MLLAGEIVVALGFGILSAKLGVNGQIKCVTIDFSKGQMYEYLSSSLLGVLQGSASNSLKQKRESIG